MANEGRGDLDPKRTVILDQQAQDKATRILGPDAGGPTYGASYGVAPGGGSNANLPPTQIIGAGSAYGGSGQSRTNPPTYGAPSGSSRTAGPGGYPPGPNAPGAGPEHTRMLMPAMEAPTGAAGTSPQTGYASPGVETPEPVVGWLVVISGPGRGGFRPIFYGNNAIGRDPSQRIPLNFGDTAISAEEQAFIRYDFETRKFALIPNLSKPNIVTHNSDKPMVPVELKPFDEIGIGTSRLRFVPLCGPDFEWSDPANQ
jgi:hypothetical protein